MADVNEMILGELRDIKNRLIRMEQSNKPTHPEWLTKAEAMRILSCNKTKLQLLVKSGQVLVNENPGLGKQIRYSLKSINKYLSGKF